MNTDIMAEALRATARVACCAALLGCSPAISEPADTDLASMSDVDSESESESETETDSLEDCRDHVVDTFAEELEPTEETVECCQMIAESYDEAELAGLEDWAERMECCSLLDWSGSMACTPWGPPVPPAMPAFA